MTLSPSYSAAPGGAAGLLLLTALLLSPATMTVKNMMASGGVPLPPCVPRGGGSGASCYALLNVPVTATAREIKKAYRAKALEVHPDKCTGCDAERRGTNQKAFVELAFAYETLSSDDTRAQYERGTGRWAPVLDGDDGDGDGGGDGFGGFGGSGGGRFSNDAWARSQFDLARDPLLTVRGWVTLMGLAGAGFGAARALKVARRGVRRGARARTVTESARLGKEKVTRAGVQTAVRAREAAGGNVMQNRGNRGGAGGKRGV